MYYNSMAQIKAHNKGIGHYWFSPGTMRFFNTKLTRTVYNGRYFITSEQRESYEPRLYSIRECIDGKIYTVGEFQAYSSLNNAIKAVKAIIESDSRKA